jgi:deoxyhypusine synthase
MTTIRQFIDHNYRHFNASALKRAAHAYEAHLAKGGKMMITLAGAMSSGELGISLAEMIRKGKVHAISCTGANLEEDMYNAVAHNHYEHIPNYRDLTPQDEQDLVDRGFNRVTDTCIPEEEAFRLLQAMLLPMWKDATAKGERYLPHEYYYRVALSKEMEKLLQIPREHSWLIAAAEANLPLYVPGWEDSTTGNIIVSLHEQGELSIDCVKSGLHYMHHLMHWYKAESAKNSIGFFQIGGGIAGDFPICAVPLMRQDLEWDIPHWGYFAQITDAQESYGGYSGALPNEKITWDKLSIDTPKFVIHSDATIVAPLIFNYVLGN